MSVNFLCKGLQAVAIPLTTATAAIALISSGFVPPVVATTALVATAALWTGKVLIWSKVTYTLTSISGYMDPSCSAYHDAKVGDELWEKVSGLMGKYFYKKYGALGHILTSFIGPFYLATLITTNPYVLGFAGIWGLFQAYDALNEVSRIVPGDDLDFVGKYVVSLLFGVAS